MRDEQMKALSDRLASIKANDAAILARVETMRREREAAEEAEGELMASGMVQIVVNGQRINVLGSSMFYESVVRLARIGAGLPPETDARYTITYRGAGGEKSDGSLLPGQSVVVKDGMKITAVITGNA